MVIMNKQITLSITPIFFSGLIILVLFLLIFLNSESLAANFSYNDLSGANFKFHLQSPQEIKFDGIVTQKADKSCGAASLATILTYYYSESVNEQEIFSSIIKFMNQKNSFSLLELKKTAENKGYKVYPLKANIEGLNNIHIPAIILLEYPSFPHFAVIRYAKGNTIYIGDPALGNLKLKYEELKSIWNGILIAIDGNGKPIKTPDIKIFQPPEAPKINKIKNIIKINAINIKEFNSMNF